MEIVEQTYPNGEVVRIPVPPGTSDEEVRAIFALEMMKRGYNNWNDARVVTKGQKPASAKPSAVPQPAQSNEAQWRGILGDQGSISEYKPRFSERIGQMLGSPELGNFLADWTPVGNADGIVYGDDTERQLSMLPLPGPAKRLARAGLGALDEAVGASVASTPGIRAYHGSPHDFDRFDLSKIGTGEGAQAYGHGLYFAENEAVARQYRDALRAPSSSGTDEISIAQRYLDDAEGDPSRALEAIRQQIEGAWQRNGTPPDALMRAKNIINTAPHRAQGRMYEVNINADPDSLLDWDAPIASQSRIIPALRDARLDGLPTGQDVINEAQYKFGRQNSAQELAARGIPGIKYLDQGSRTAGQGSRNFVVFDDALIEIMRKYGLAMPALGAAGLATYGAQPAPDQRPGA